MKKFTTKSGFTLIEIIVSLGVFSVVVTIAVGALLVMVAANQQLQSEQSVMTSLSFALDSMTREIRTGTGYGCHYSANDSGGTNSGNPFSINTNIDGVDDVDDVDDCDASDYESGSQAGPHRFFGISFVESGDSISGANDRVLYYYNENEQAIFRRVGSETPVPITSVSSVIINEFRLSISDSTQSGVVGVGRNDQPTVTIFIDASGPDNPNKHFYIQTTVTQRTLDL